MRENILADNAESEDDNDARVMGPDAAESSLTAEQIEAMRDFEKRAASVQALEKDLREQSAAIRQQMIELQARQ